MNSLARRWAVLGVGVALLLSGVACTINAGIGTGSWQVLETGIVEATGYGLGPVLVVESLVALAVAWVWLDQRPGPATVVLALGGGPVVEALTNTLPEPETFPAGAAMLLIGATLVGVGVGLYVPAELGPSAQDSLFVGLYRRYSWRPGTARLLTDATFVAAGWALGGQVGAGTVVVTVLVPVLVDAVIPHGHRLAGTEGATPVTTTTAV